MPFSFSAWVCDSLHILYLVAPSCNQEKLKKHGEACQRQLEGLCLEQIPFDELCMFARTMAPTSALLTFARPLEPQ